MPDDQESSGPPRDPGALPPLAERVEALEQTVAGLKRQVDALLAPRSAQAAARPAPPAPVPAVAPPGAAPPVSLPPIARGGPDLEGVIAGRWLPRVGLVTVTVGISYFLKYSIDNDWIGPSGQVALGILLGAALLASVPWFVKRGYGPFADIMTGLGVAILYLSLWAGGNYYHLFSLDVTFAAMAVVTAGTVGIAMGRNSQPVAVMAMVGGFLSPTLVSTGHDAEIGLFTYLAVLSCGLLLIARARAWWLELPSLVLTQAYFWSWYTDFYSDDKLLVTSAFAALFFAIFLVLPALGSRQAVRVPFERAILVPLNAGLCLLAFRAMLWPTYRWPLTAAALLLAVVHAIMARLAPASGGRGARLLYGGVALTLVTLVIPIRLDGRWVTIAWTIEGAVLMWTGFRVRERSVRALAFILFAIAVWRLTVFPLPAEVFLLNPRFGAELVTIVCFAFALWLGRHHAGDVTDAEQLPLRVLGLAVNVLAVWALTDEARRYFAPAPFSPFDPDAQLAQGLAVSVLWTLYASGLMFFGVHRAVAGLRWQGLALFGLTTLKVFLSDLSFLNGFYRIASSIALGVVLLGVSFIYQRSLAAAAPRQRP